MPLISFFDFVSMYSICCCLYIIVLIFFVHSLKGLFLYVLLSLCLIIITKYTTAPSSLEEMRILIEKCVASFSISHNAFLKIIQEVHLCTFSDFTCAIFPESLSVFIYVFVAFQCCMCYKLSTINGFAYISAIL